MILVSFSSAEDALFSDVKKHTTFSSQGIETLPFRSFGDTRYIAKCGLSRSNSQNRNLKIWRVASDLPWTPSHVRLPIEPALFAFSQTAHGKELGEWSSIEMLVYVHATDSLMTIVSV